MDTGTAILISAVMREAARLADQAPDNPLTHMKRIMPGHIEWAIQDVQKVLVALSKSGLLQGLRPL